MSRNSDCIFCKIVEGGIPSPWVYEDESFICIRDIHPQAKTHLLVIPRTHIASLAEAYPQGGKNHHGIMSQLFEVTVKIAWHQKLLPFGFRTVINTGKGGGQTVDHLHLHILGGEQMPEAL